MQPATAPLQSAAQRNTRAASKSSSASKSFELHLSKGCILPTMALKCQLALVVLCLLAPFATLAQEKSDLDFLAAMDEFHYIRKMLPARLALEVNEHLRQRAGSDRETIDSGCNRRASQAGTRHHPESYRWISGSHAAQRTNHRHAGSWRLQD